MGPEKRTDRRQELVWSAQIVDLDGNAVGECETFDVSASGAKLTLQADIQVPDEFRLVLARDGSVQRQCKVKWRSEADIGVQFVRLTAGAKKLFSADQ